MTRSAAPSRLAAWAGPAVLVAAFLVLLTWTWQAWADVRIDFGRELYVAWQLAAGKTLYADIAYFNGPLSPAVNATLFRLFGTSVRTLTFANLAILVAVGVMVHWLLRQLVDRVAATAGTLAFLVFFAFEGLPGGNYNFVAPYSHEMTHGSALAAGALVLLAIRLRGAGLAVVFAMGCAAGLTFLTKAEFLIAIVPALVLGLILDHRARHAGPHEGAAVAAAFAAGAAVPPAVALLALLQGLPASEAMTGVAGSWAHLFNAGLRDLRFYREIAGTLDTRESAVRLGAWTLRYALVLTPALLAALLLPRRSPRTSIIVFMLSVVVATITLLGRGSLDWESTASPFPLLLVAAIAGTMVSMARSTGEDGRRWQRRLGLCCLVYALALLLKMFFNVRILHYGFALAMPAGVAVVAILLGVVPDWLNRRGSNGPAFRWVAAGTIAAFTFVHVAATGARLDRRTVAVGTGADTLLVDVRDRAFLDAVARFEQLRAPGDTLAVIPEGVMLNYLTRAENPTPYVNFMPPEFVMFGEDRIAGAFRSRPPTWIVLMNRAAAEYGFRFLGDDYGQALFAFVEANYTVVDRLLETDANGVRQPFAAILRHNAAAQAASPPPGRSLAAPPPPAPAVTHRTGDPR